MSVLGELAVDLAAKYLVLLTLQLLVLWELMLLEGTVMINTDALD